MKKQKYYVTYTPEETSMVLEALNRLRNSLLQEGRDPACVDDLFLKVMNASPSYNSNSER